MTQHRAVAQPTFTLPPVPVPAPTAPALPPALKELAPYFGHSAVMRQVLESIQSLGPTNKPVLLLGEAGSGKQVVARAMHALRAPKGDFVSVGVGAVAASLVACELFGTCGGTGAWQRAAGGTLYLEGVEDLPMVVQNALFQRLQTPGKDDPRVIVSSRASLEDMVTSGYFLKPLDTLLRCNPVYVPALRERAEDMPHLISFCGGSYANGKKARFSREAMKLLHDYTWPGNLRELSLVLHRLMPLVKAGDTVSAETLRQVLPDVPDCLKATSLPQAADLCLAQYFESLRGLAPVPNLYDKVVAEVEKPLIMHVLRYARGNQLRAAEILGLNRNTLRKKMSQLGIDGKKRATPRKGGVSV